MLNNLTMIFFTGVYPNDDLIDNPRVSIDISDVNELKGHSFDQNLCV